MTLENISVCDTHLLLWRPLPVSKKPNYLEVPLPTGPTGSRLGPAPPRPAPPQGAPQKSGDGGVPRGDVIRPSGHPVCGALERFLAELENQSGCR